MHFVFGYGSFNEQNPPFLPLMMTAAMNCDNDINNITIKIIWLNRKDFSTISANPQLKKKTNKQIYKSTCFCTSIMNNNALVIYSPILLLIICQIQKFTLEILINSMEQMKINHEIKILIKYPKKS